MATRRSLISHLEPILAGSGWFSLGPGIGALAGTWTFARCIGELVGVLLIEYSRHYPDRVTASLRDRQVAWIAARPRRSGRQSIPVARAYRGARQRRDSAGAGRARPGASRRLVGRARCVDRQAAGIGRGIRRQRLLHTAASCRRCDGSRSRGGSRSSLRDLRDRPDARLPTRRSRCAAGPTTRGSARGVLLGRRGPPQGDRWAPGPTFRSDVSGDHGVRRLAAG
jgi:hypothetical protein